MSEPKAALHKALAHYHNYWHSDLRIAECPEDICAAGLSGLATLDAERARPDALREALSELDDWKAGRRSYMNLGPYPPYTPDVIAAMDAQEVVKLGAYVQALAAVALNGKEPTDG